eukprot:1669030-Alexandrium_andersonii.AAC.1
MTDRSLRERSLLEAGSSPEGPASAVAAGAVASPSPPVALASIPAVTVFDQPSRKSPMRDLPPSE